ncbi:MAG: polymer-forming cytoskeletal protein, partial [Anaerolineales bacterium]|nr:polymer-forming cytoskeletal protein [Anaerolineales bacterium]
MTVAKNRQRGLGLFGGRDRHPSKTITEYHLEDIISDEAIYIAPGAIVAGDVYAPRVVVAGLIYGFVVSLVVEIETGAEIWGDVYARQIQIARSAQLNGWVSTLNEDEYRALRQSDTELGLWMANRSDSSLNTLPEELHQNVQDTIASMPPGRVNVLRRLQLEIGAALVARAELEQAFEERVQEVAGESLSEAGRLRTQIASLTAEQNTKAEQLNQLQTRLQNREKELTDEKQALIEAQALIDQQVSRIEELDT